MLPNTLIKYVYDRFIRDKLPKKIGTYAGIPVRKVPLFDNKDTWPDYHKENLIRLTRVAVDWGDTVVVVGGGIGVSAAAAANATGEKNSVVIYEASQDLLEELRETMELNAVEDRVDIQHAIIGEAHDIDGTPGEASVVEPRDLPKCDVLQLDCEGSELQILKNLTSEPQKIVVETHPNLAADTPTVRKLLIDMGYNISEEKSDPASGDILLATRD